MMVEVPTEIESALNNYMLRTGVSREQVIANALAEYLSEQQDLMVAVQRRKDVLEGRDHTVSLEELMDRYGVER